MFDATMTIIGVLEFFMLPRHNLELGLGSLRQFRLIRISNNFPVFVNMRETIMASFPEAAAVIILLGVAIFIFGCILTTIFPAVKYGMVLGPSNNPSTILGAMILLFKMSSGAGGTNPATSWGDYVVDASINVPFCTQQLWLPTPATALQDSGEWGYLSPMGFSGKLGVVAERSDCGSPEIAKIFFLLFMFIIMFIITPTFVASVPKP